MKQDKLFDCVFIATDSKNVKKVRFANDHDKRQYVLNRDKFVIHYSHKFESKLTKQEIINYLSSTEANVDVNDEEAIDEAQRRLNKAKTEVKDVLAAILSRKQDDIQQTEVVE